MLEYISLAVAIAVFSVVVLALFVLYVLLLSE